MDKYEKFLSRYESNTVPWDHELPPPELIALADAMQPGKVLDLGCGYGRTVRYLAARGWTADGVDFVELAIDEARKRLGEVPFAKRVRFFHSTVTAMPYLDQPYDLIVDIGCMHSLTEASLRAYAAEVTRLLQSGGTYLLFAHINDGEEEGEDAPKGIAEAQIHALFSHFELIRAEYGETQVEDKPPWASAWFWFRK